MPAAQKVAADNNIDAGGLAGSGRGGRVTKGDVLDSMQGGQPAAKAPSAPAPSLRAAAPPIDLGALGERPEQRVPMSRLRARIAERLLQSQSTAAILTTFNEVDRAPVMALRSKYQEQFTKRYGIKLGFMSFFVKGAIEGLKAFPAINGWIEGHDIVYHDYFDIGVAVSSDRGLVVPVVRDADQLSFAESETAIGNFGKRARDGKITVDELTGGTFTVSNGGVFGSLMSTPILNPPQSGILGMHKIQDRPVVVNGQIVIRPMMYVALSYDHRIVDGREAVQFLVKVKECVEDPTRILLGV